MLGQPPEKTKWDVRKAWGYRMRDLDTSFTKHRAPDWACPSCNRTSLKLVPDSVHEEETRESVHRREAFEENWDPVDERSVFVAILKCDHCGEVLTTAGVTSVRETFQAPDEVDYVVVFDPHYVSAAPHIFALANAVPKEIQELTARAFQLFWTDDASCANAIRQVIEAVLTDQKVPRYPRAKPRAPGTKAKARSPLSLGTRILAYEKKRQELKDHLHAIRWIGNAGSHSRRGAKALQRSDLFDAFEILRLLLTEIYEEQTARLKAMAKQISTTKKPRSAVTKRT
jgi:hypothetical protein